MTTLLDIRETARRLASMNRGRDIRDLFADWRDALLSSPQRRRQLRSFAIFGLPPLVIVAALSGWLIFRPVPKPDYATADIAQLFNFTLLTNEFNRLPVEERVELLGQLLQRMNSMSASDSVVMAAFAAGIAGQARDQIERNASRLMIDLWDKYAKDYENVAHEDRGAFLDASLIEITRMMEAMGGRTRDISDSQRLAEINQQAKRDQEMMRGERAPPPEALVRAFSYVRNNVGERASPAQRARAQQLMLDMTRRVRGEPLTGRR
jgi:hypothetical protein